MSGMKVQAYRQPPQTAPQAPALAARKVDVPQEELPWSSLQQPSTQLQELPDGHLHLNVVRWGLNEQGPPEQWTGHFSDCRIDPKQIKNVYIGQKPFAPTALAAHTTLIFEMDEKHPITNREGGSDPALVLSMEARMREGEPYVIKETLKGTYPVVYQLQTWTDLVQKSTRKEPLEQIRYKLELTEAQKEQLLRNTLAAASAPRETDRYNLFTNSCHSAAIDLVNTVMPEEQQVNRWILPHIYNPLAAFPAHGDILYAEHGWLSNEPRMVVQADDRLYPGVNQAPGWLHETSRNLSSSNLWKPACGLAGAAAGAALGAALPGIAGPIAATLGALGGARVGLALGETVRRRTHNEVHSASEFYPKV
jgi:hypothetical protein